MHSEDWHCIDYLSSVDTCTWLICLDCAHAAIIITSVCLLCINMIFGTQVDWEELEHKLGKLERDCKSSWDHLRAIAKHEGGSTSNLKSK